MNSAELKRAKRAVRRRMLAVRDAMPERERVGVGATIAERFLALAEVRSASTVLAFWSFGSELPTEPIIDALCARGVRVVLPRIVAGELEARAFRPGDDVTVTSFGAYEPAGGALVQPNEIDVVAVPAVAFDRACHRIGYGGGFYDRFLPTLHADSVRIGIGYGVQLMTEGESLPAGHFDLMVDLVVTESETVRCRWAI
ncbi:5-formyltetrahydrofolate cyclo-ligase [soil metagenome]